MRVTINKIDGVVGINGVFRMVDLSELPASLRVVQWNESTGHEEWTNQENTAIGSINNYQWAIDAWTAAGQVVPPEIPIEEQRQTMTCGPLQIRRALRAIGLIDEIKAYMASAPEETIEAWEYATEIKRSDPLVIALQSTLSKSDEEVDDLFRLALTLA